MTRRYTAKGYQDYHYDVNGRLAKKIVHTRGFRPREWRYLWNTQNQLTACFTPKGDCWHYTYDAFGRRLSKTKTVDSDLAHIDPLFPQIKPKITTWRYLWSGDQLIEETPIYADGTLAVSQQIQWLYQLGEIMPTARYQQGKLHYVVTDHQGTPREIFSEGGQASWAGRLNTWGQMQFWRYREGKAENDPNYTECPFRFAGQYEDEESGLYYNRFRYYDRETGQYLSPDPIGLLGGLNPYGYVHCPTGWVDPFGLECCPTSLISEQRQARINELAEANALRRLQEMESMNPRSHFLERHGAQTSLESQLGRATNGANPTTGVQQRTPMAATRFDSHRDQLNAIQRAQTIQRQSGGAVTKVTIPYGRRIGEGYSKTGPTYGTSSTATVILTPNGQTITAYPVWGR
nr:RHS repeat-associated core domain-containing protein [Proteus mirabilis]